MVLTIAHRSLATDPWDYTPPVARPVGFRARFIGVLVIGVSIAGACLPTSAPAMAPGTRACVGLPAAQCEPVFADAEARARQRGTFVVGIIVRCTGVCTEAGGEAETSVTFADGTNEQGGFGWQQAAPAPDGGPPGPDPSLPVAPTCIGLDAAICESRALESVSDPEPGQGEIVSIVVRCTPGPCLPAKGAGETTITFADGQERNVRWDYSGSP